MRDDSSKLIIHIGLHKTATTYLQYNVFPSLNDVVYIHGNQFFKQWQQQSNVVRSNMLMSFEGFSGNAWKSDDSGRLIKGKDNNWFVSFERNITNLRKFFPDAVILILMRRPGDLLVSMYKQYIQEGGTLRLEEFYSESGIISLHDLTITDRISFLLEQFDTCYFLNYEMLRKRGDDYIIEFFNKEFNIQIKSNTKDVVKSNSSISGGKIELLRKINKFYVRLPRSTRKVLRYLRISPRDILQRYLSFINPTDPQNMIDVREEVNRYFVEEWNSFERNHQWS